jgi:hypothetical protein
MNLRADHERLFADALADEAPAGFREALLSQTLRHARARRRWRQVRRGATALAGVVLLAVLMRLILPQPPLAVPVAGCEIIHTRPLPAAAFVNTVPLQPNQLVAPVATVGVIHTDLAVVTYREIGDGELLALVAPRPAVLVGCGPHCAQLIFVNPDDEKGFPVN